MVACPAPSCKNTPLFKAAHHSLTSKLLPDTGFSSHYNFSDGSDNTTTNNNNNDTIIME